MEIKKCTQNDLPILKHMYKEIIEHMSSQGITIWDDIYPYEFFKEDIKNNRLYALLDNDTIVAAFALCETNNGESYVNWNHPSFKSIYLDRVGVNVAYLRQGIGGQLLTFVREKAKALQVEYIRLFVVDCNQPAINFYIKNGFHKVEGVYVESFEDGFELCEYGFEIKIS